MTLEEFRGVIQEFSKVEGLVYPATLQALWVQITYGAAQIAGWQMVQKDSDGKITVNFDDQRFKDVVKFYHDLAQVDKLIPSVATYAAEGLNRRAMLARGETGLILDGPFTLVWLQNFMFNDPGDGPLPFQLGLAEMPVLTEADKSAASYNELAGAFYAPSTCKNLLEAYRFMRFFNNGNFDINGSYMPVYTKAKLEDAVATFLNYTDAKGTKHANIYPLETAIKAVTVPNDSFLGVYPMDPELLGKYVPILARVVEEEFPTYLNDEIPLEQFIGNLTVRGQSEIYALQD
jgi:ABC-type glycerol-3-phosphate transport system substrate-binding protein